MLVSQLLKFQPLQYNPVNGYKQIFSRCKSTIFALSSGYGKCGVAVIRISGPKSKDTIMKMTSLKKLPTPRKATLHLISDCESHMMLDRGLILWFPAPNSFTGEDCCELQVHGGMAVVSSILTALSKMDDYRPANPGEFTRRAFYAGKLDLTEVEGLADLIEAETEFQRRQALYQMEGNLSGLYSEWRKTLSQCLAFVEAYIDFSEEQNIEDNILVKVEVDLRKLCEEMQVHLMDGRKGEILRNGVRTSILGAPNVGKSSLLNTFCEKQAAIVTEIPGTTRDIIEKTLNVNGYPLLLADTAGLRSNANDIVELEGINRTYSHLKNSDFLILLVDVIHVFDFLDTKFNDLLMENINTFYYFFCEFLKEYIQSLKLSDLFSVCTSLQNSCNSNMSIVNRNKSRMNHNVLGKEDGKRSSIKCSKNFLIVLNKIDLLDGKKYSLCSELSKIDKYIVSVSCKTQDNISHLTAAVTNNLATLCGNPSQEVPVLSQVRHRYHINECCLEIKNYFDNNDDSTIVFGAEHLREAVHNVGKITGHVSSEELLDIIFKQFCIGK